MVESDDEDLGQMDAKVRESVGICSMSCGVWLATALEHLRELDFIWLGA